MARFEEGAAVIVGQTGESIPRRRRYVLSMAVCPTRFPPGLV